MEKTTGALMVAMVISVMGIPIAYFAGQRSVEATLAAELTRTQSEQESLIAEVHQKLTEVALRLELIGAGAAQSPIGAGVAATQPLQEWQRPTELSKAPDPVIDFAIFESLAVGATYERIVDRLGREGARTLSIVGQDGTVTEQYVWDWIKPDGTPGKIDLSFFGGKLQDKIYKG